MPHAETRRCGLIDPADHRIAVRGEKYRGQFLFALRIRPHGRDVSARLHPIRVKKGGGSRGCCDNDVCGANGGFGFSNLGRQPTALKRLGERGNAGRIAADHPDAGQWADAGNRFGLITGLVACAENRQNRSKPSEPQRLVLPRRLSRQHQPLLCDSSLGSSPLPRHRCGLMSGRSAGSPRHGAAGHGHHWWGNRRRP